MKPIDYDLLLKQLSNVLRVAKKLGLNVVPNGGYAMSYSINRLPPYPVGLFGALSIVDGEGARGKLGLSFDETQAIEAGFNGQGNKKQKKRGRTYPELEAIGIELSKGYKHSLARYADANGGLRMGTPVRPTANRAMPEWHDAEPIHPAVPEELQPMAPYIPPAQPGIFINPAQLDYNAWNTGTITTTGGMLTITGGAGGMGGTAAAATTYTYATEMARILDQITLDTAVVRLDHLAMPTEDGDA